MHASAKYLIHATVRTGGVVERTDVVGAIFGQTEGLLGDDLDLRELQESSKLGRIDVDIDSEGGRSVGTITVASGLDRAETAVLAAALETMERVGPCRAECTVTSIEDARAAKRRELVDRATELLDDLEQATVTSEEIVEEVRRQARVEEITAYEGLPAGPRVRNSDAIIVVEGRADVRRLLKFGIRNAVAVEGTDVPDEIAELTFERNTTAFLDGDRGGDLILRELQQVADVGYVAFAPTDRSVEDLDRTEILSALRRKVPLEQVTEGQTPREAFGPTETPVEPVERSGETDDALETAGDGGSAEAGSPSESSSGDQSPLSTDERPASGATEPEMETASESGSAATESESAPDSEPDPSDGPETDDGNAGPDRQDAAVDDVSAGVQQNGSVGEPAADADEASQRTAEPQTLAGHVEAVIGEERKTARFLDPAFDTVEEVDVDDAFETLAEVDPAPSSVLVDGTLTQQLLDLAAQRGVGQVVAATTGEFVKQPTDVRVRTAGDLETSA